MHQFSKVIVTPILLVACLLAGGPANAQTCDDLAASPHDIMRPDGIAGVESDRIDVASALPACTLAFEAAREDPRVMFQLGRVLLASGETDKATAMFEGAMKAGHVAAAVNYGAVVEERNPQAAFAAYTQAAQAGLAIGQFNLGVAYRDGIGTEPDGAKAIEWLTKAENQGDPWAAYNLGVIFDEAKLATRDMQRAVGLYRKAAEGGVVDAMVNLGFVLEKGDGVPANRDEAMRFFEQAAKLGDKEAGENLVRMKSAN